MYATKIKELTNRIECASNSDAKRALALQREILEFSENYLWIRADYLRFIKPLQFIESRSLCSDEVNTEEKIMNLINEYINLKCDEVYVIRLVNDDKTFKTLWGVFENIKSVSVKHLIATFVLKFIVVNDCEFNEYKIMQDIQDCIIYYSNFMDNLKHLSTDELNDYRMYINVCQEEFYGFLEYEKASRIREHITDLYEHILLNR